MPRKAKSKAQWRALFAKLGPKKAKEMVKGQSYKSLPARKHRKKKK